MKQLTLFFLITILFFASCSSSNEKPVENPEEPTTPPPTDITTDEELSFLNVPDGFAVQVYADEIDNARQLALSESGTLFIGSRRDKVHAVKDRDNDGRTDTTFVIASDLNTPNGVALKDGDLYVAEISRIIRFNDVEENLSDNMSYEVVFDGYPEETHHGWKFISFGPDGKLYVPVGAPCNICDREEDIFNSITRLNADGTEMEIVHEGIRNTVGFNWHPENNHLWFTDNGRDNMGDNQPGDELNYAGEDGLHYGYPYCHQGDIPDPEFGEEQSCDEFVAPAQVLGPHVAALGIEFWNNENFPATMNGKAFIAEHGSWNRSTPIGYRLMTVDVTADGEASNYQVFLNGFRNNDTDTTHGRPVDLEWMSDGSLLVSDDHANQVYRIVYTGS